MEIIGAKIEGDVADVKSRIAMVVDQAMTEVYAAEPLTVQEVKLRFMVNGSGHMFTVFVDTGFVSIA